MPAPDPRPDLRALSRADLSVFVESLGEPGYRTDQLFQWIHQRGARSFEEITVLSKVLRQQLSGAARLGRLTIASVEVARDGTRKYALRTERDDTVEAVFIPDASAEGRNTLCISSQVGCGLDCKFCLTASLGLIRNLNAGEIVEQLVRVKEDLLSLPGDAPRGVQNLVLMGMGEPLQNYDALVQALAIFSDPAGHNVSPRRITVSTAGLASRIPRLGHDTKVNLAVSLNATTDVVRDQIMPINTRFNIAALLDACREFPLPERRRITFEYVLLQGVNDSDDDARRLVRLLDGFRCKVNLIPYNEHPYSPFHRPSADRIHSFQQILLHKGLSAFVRSPRGDDISAACGQLGVKVEGPKRVARLVVLDG